MGRVIALIFHRVLANAAIAALDDRDRRLLGLKNEEPDACICGNSRVESPGMGLPTQTLIAALCLGATAFAIRSEQQFNTLTSAEKSAGWRLLFDGHSLTGWHAFGKANAGAPGKPQGWDFVDGTLVATGQGSASTDDIVTDDEFTNFEFVADWKVGPQANSGIFYGVVEQGTQAIYETGPEYQLIDEDGWSGPLEAWQKNGADYAMHPPLVKAAKPAGQWNHTRIVVNGTHVQLFLNGATTADFERWTPEWEQLKKTGKWKDYPKYGVAKTGRLGLQNHGNVVTFRDIKVLKR